MKKFLIYIHAFILNPILNIIPFFLIDVCYDNQSHIGNALNHPIYLIAWATSCSIGFYVYSKKIWQHDQIPYSKILHSLICIGLILSCIIPYSQNNQSWINDIHLWLAITCTTGFIFEWIYYSYPFVLKTNKYIKNIKTLFLLVGLCLVSMLVPGHITSLCEILFSFTINAYLAYWILSQKI